MPATQLPVINPASGERIATLACDSIAEISAKVARARSAQRAWASTPLSERIEAISRFASALTRERERLARILTREMGKPIAQARAEIGATPARIQFFIDNVAAVLGDEKVWDDAGSGTEEHISSEALGVVAHISAWNYPYFVGTNAIVPALLTGNAVLYKPSEHAAMTGVAIAELMVGVGVPADVLLPVIGGGDVGSELLSEAIDAIFFTGSYRTGVAVSRAVAGRMMQTQLELGGKDPAYICDEIAPVAAAAAMAEGAFYNNGQSCCAVERIYVHEKIADEFLAALAAEVRSFRIGDPLREDTYIGPVARPAQIEHLERQVRDAQERGARLVCGGHRLPGPGSYFEPTILANVDHSMEVMREETFGPVIGVQAVSSDEDAIEKMSDTTYGLTAAVYCRDADRARRILQRMDTGSVYWNCCDRVSPRLPWSGRRHSGIGTTLSRQGIRCFTRPKAWHLRRPDGSR